MVALKLLLAASTGLVTAWPEPADRRAIDCAKVTGALSVLKKVGPPATTFCSSFLKIPATTTLKTTVTPNAVTVAISTTTYTSYVLLSCPVVKQRNDPFELAEPVYNAEKRDDILLLLAAFAATKVSEGCSCLGFQPRATTTATVAAATPIVKVVATTTVCQKCKSEGPAYTCSSNAECCGQSCGGPSGTTYCCIPKGYYCGPSIDQCCSGVCDTSRGAGQFVCT